MATESVVEGFKQTIYPLEENDPHIRREAIKIWYKNHESKWSQRFIIPRYTWYGTLEPWYKDDPQWFLDAYDIDKGAVRSFAFKRMDL